MTRRSARPQPDRTCGSARPHAGLLCLRRTSLVRRSGPARRTVATLEGLVQLRLRIRSCRNPDCP